jgi:protein-tyrosine phosphatase
MPFADIHIHALCGVDDGAKTDEDMFAIIDAAYADGTRLMCVTPHFNPGMFGEHHERTVHMFEKLKSYVSEKYPDLALFLGNEIRYAPSCHNWIYDGVCFSLGDTKYVLMEFSYSDGSAKIINGLEKMFNSGFIPILAHAERYPRLSIPEIRALRDNGVLIQVDSMSLLRDFGFSEWFRSKRILKERLADFVSSDAHDLTSRPPELSPSFEYVKKKFGERYAKAIFYENACELFGLNKESEV